MAYHQFHCLSGHKHWAAANSSSPVRIVLKISFRSLLGGRSDYRLTSVHHCLSMWNTLFVLLLINKFGWYLERPLKNKLVGPTKLLLEMSSPQVHVGMWCSLQFECEAQWRWVPMFSGWLHAMQVKHRLVHKET